MTLSELRFIVAVGREKILEKLRKNVLSANQHSVSR